MKFEYFYWIAMLPVDHQSENQKPNKQSCNGKSLQWYASGLNCGHE